MRRVFMLAMAFAFLSPPSAFPYSYAEVEDPTALIFKKGVLAASKNEWENARKFSEEGIVLLKGHIIEADHLKPKFTEVITAKNVSKTAEAFANLVYISIQNKFRANLEEKLKNYKTSKARLFMARKSYIDILDGNVKKQDTKRSETILKQFDNALKALGSPGLFGVGKKEADLGQYKDAISAIETSIEKTFPSFKR